MFSFWKRKREEKCQIYAPVPGKCIDISQVPDRVFSQKVMGDGIAVIPSKNIICAPCDGIVTMIFETNHAFEIKSKDGTEVLIHIGLETVNLQGKGFERLVSCGTKVKHGDPIIEVDENYLNSEIDLVTMVMIPDLDAEIKKLGLNQSVCIDTVVIA